MAYKPLRLSPLRVQSSERVARGARDFHAQHKLDLLVVQDVFVCGALAAKNDYANSTGFPLARPRSNQSIEACQCPADVGANEAAFEGKLAYPVHLYLCGHHSVRIISFPRPYQWKGNQWGKRSRLYASASLLRFVYQGLGSEYYIREHLFLTGILLGIGYIHLTCLAEIFKC